LRVVEKSTIPYTNLASSDNDKVIDTEVSTKQQLLNGVEGYLSSKAYEEVSRYKKEYSCENIKNIETFYHLEF